MAKEPGMEGVEAIEPADRQLTRVQLLMIFGGLLEERGDRMIVA